MIKKLYQAYTVLPTIKAKASSLTGKIRGLITTPALSKKLLTRALGRPTYSGFTRIGPDAVNTSE